MFMSKFIQQTQEVSAAGNGTHCQGQKKEIEQIQGVFKQKLP